MARRSIGEQHKWRSGVVRQVPLTEARKRIFLEELRRHGVVAEAARVASPLAQSKNGASKTFYAERHRDFLFAEAWDDAVEQADARLEAEAVRRAVEGVERGVFQKGTRAVDHDGKPATVTEYSDRLLEVLMRSRISRYSEKRQVEVNVNHGVQRLSLSPSDLLALSPNDRAALMHILEQIARNRGECEEVESEPLALNSGESK